MNKKIKSLFFPFLLILILLFLNFINYYSGIINLFDYVIAQTSSQVTVSAYVMPTVTCNAATSSSNFGIIDANSVYSSSPNVTTTISCPNSSLGCTLLVKDNGNGTNPGLYNAFSSYLIQSNDATLVAGTEGYGIQGVTTTAGSGAILMISSKYNKSGNQVGGLSLTSLTLASSSSFTTNREVVIIHKLSISSLTPSGNYSDTITYSCIAN